MMAESTVVIASKIMYLSRGDSALIAQPILLVFFRIFKHIVSYGINITKEGITYTCTVEVVHKSVPTKP